jgi:hypothetical protein
MIGHRRSTTRGAVALTAAALALSACADSGDTGDSDVPFVDADSGTEQADTERDGQSTVGTDGEGNISTALTLQSASIRTTDTDTDREEFVEYCFAESINDVGDGGSFALVGFDSKQRIEATSAVLNEDDRNCVVVGYEAGTDLISYALATTESGAVESRDGEVNPQDSVEIAGLGDEGEARRGATSAPELLGVRVDRDLDQAVFVFDENELREGSGNAGAFGFYTADGRATTGSSVVSVEDSRAVVQFDEGTLNDAIRFFVQEGAVADQQGTESNLASEGRRTAAPDLVSVSARSESEYDFRFDDSVDQEQGQSFFLYTSDGKELTGTTVSRPAPDTVRVVFPEAVEVSDSLVRAAVGEDAVQSLGASSTGNTIGAARIAGGGSDQGATSGPDLISVDADNETGRATFTFDAVLTEDSVSADGFSLITASGDIVTARELVEVTGGEVTGNTVIVLFGRDKR